MSLADGETAPQIGIFWRVHASGAAPVLLVDCVPAAVAEPYGDFLTHGGHYEFWTKARDPETRSSFAAAISPTSQNGLNTRNGRAVGSCCTC